MAIPQSTRLRFVKSKDAEVLVEFINKLKMRVQIYSISHADGAWHCWFVPPDDSAIDVPQVGDLD